MSAGAACNQTGCPGSYADGYCDVCGFPEPPGSAASSGPQGTGGSGIPTATAASTLAQEEAARRPDAETGGAATGATGARPASTRPTGPAGTTGQTGTTDPDAWTGSTSSRGSSSSPLPPEQQAVVVPHVAGHRAGTRGPRGARGVALGTARGTGVTRRVGPGPRRGRGSSLGAGLTIVPTAPSSDPADAVMARPEVPEEKRNCPSCGTPVGRGQGDAPGRTEGYCPKCRNPYSFTPKLHPGDLVGGQYEVVGCLAHGGLGWIYLARDKNVSDRWVVLKGLLNAGDADALAAAVAEQRFLAQVEHPHIVEVYNVVTHDGAAYTVMEYVGGTSLKEMLKERMAANGGVYDPLPVEHALAFVLEILPAFAYLHDLGLLYCDFKPDNLIQVGDSVKLIDLGGMRRIDDLDSPIYGTVGYQAPEIAEVGPSVPSDIYTIGRTLAVLTTEFRGYQTRFATSLPPVSTMPAFERYESFYRLVAKACALDPADRFQTIEELRTQLYGVLRQIVADRRGGGAASQTIPSTLFDAPVVTGDSLGWWELPSLRVDEHDPMLGWLQTLRELDPARRASELASAPEQSAEVLLERARTALYSGRHADVVTATDALLTQDPWDWRALWVLGIDALARDDTAGAEAAFTTVHEQVPGELAPRLALGLTHELSGARETAESDYLICLRTDAAYTTAAAFGLARLRSARGDSRGAITALDLVPPAAAAFGRARWLRAELSVHSTGDLAAFDQALRDGDRLEAAPMQRADFRVRVLEQALAAVTASAPPRGTTIGGVAANPRQLRLALEDAYRALAALTTEPGDRAALVDKANAVRPWSLR